MKLAKSLIIIFFVYAITLGFFEQISRESYESFSSENNEYFYKNDFVMVLPDPIYTVGKIDYNMLSEKYDFAISQYRVHKNYVEPIVYFNEEISISNLFAATSSCKVPFSSQNNDCGFIYTEDYAILSTDLMENYDGKDPSISDNLVIIKREDLSEFVDEIKSLYDLNDNNLLIIEYEEDYGNAPSRVDLNIENILIILAVATCIISIIQISSKVRSFRIQNIYGSSFAKVYFTNIFYDNLKFVLFLLLCVVVVLSYLMLNYSVWLAKYYITSNIFVLVVFTSLIFITSFITFSLCYISSTFNFLNNSYTYKKLSLFTTLLAILVLLIFTIKLPYSELRNKTEEYYNYMNYTQKILDLNFASYTTKLYSNPNENIKYSNLEIKEFQAIIKNNEFEIKDRNSYPTLIYMSPKMAMLETEYEYQANKNYFVGSKCSSYEPIENVFNISKHISKNIIKSGSLLTDDTCIVVVGNISDDISNYFIPYIDATRVFAHDLESNLFMRRGIQATSNPYYILETRYKLIEYVIWMSTLILVNTLLLVTYINSYRKYEYYRYINDAKYPLLFRYIVIKMIVNLSLFSLIAVNQSLVYMVPIIITDIICYLIFTCFYQRRFDKLIK